MKQMLVFILFAATLCWCMFSPIYKHVFIMRQALLQKEVDYMLEVGANGSHGYVSPAMVEQSRERLRAFGFDPGSLEYEISSTSGAVATNVYQPLLRGTGLQLRIQYPYEGLFAIDSLIGLQPVSSSSRISAYGIRMSEYVP